MTNQSFWAQGISAKSATPVAGPAKRQAAANGAAGEYARILAEKIASIEDDLKRMEKEREDIQEIDTLRRDAEERGTLRTQAELPETVKRVMGDGTILVTTTKDGKIVEQYRKKPRLVPVADEAAPKNALPSKKFKWVPKQNPLELLECI